MTLDADVLPYSHMDSNRLPYGDLDSHLCGRAGVGSERGNLPTQRGDDTGRGMTAKDPLSKPFWQRLTVGAPTLFALETTQPREIWVPVRRGSRSSLSELGEGRKGSSVAQSLHEIGPRSPEPS